MKTATSAHLPIRLMSSPEPKRHAAPRLQQSAEGRSRTSETLLRAGEQKCLEPPFDRKGIFGETKLER